MPILAPATPPPPPPVGTAAVLVQTVDGATSGSTLTLNFGAATTVGNGVIVTLTGYVGGVVSNITLGGVGSTFTKQATSTGINCEIWGNLQVAQASTTLVITTTTAGIAAWAYEIQSPWQAANPGARGITGPNVALDKKAGASSTGTSWSSGATGTTVSPVEFVVGCGMIVNAGTITGPGGSWANRPAHTNVGGASTFGGISGYQLPSATGTFTYSGTAGTSGTWGGVTATFLTMPQAGGGGSWSGYNWEPEQCPLGGYTGISASFTVPALTGPAPSPAGFGFTIWVGLGNANPQTGIYCTWNTGKPGNNAISNWTFFDGGSETWDATAYPTAAGDALTLSVVQGSQYFYITQANATQAWSYTEQKSIQAVATGGTGLVVPKNVAQVLLESEGGNSSVTPDFGTVTFTAATASPTPLGPPVPWVYVLNDIVSVPGAYSGGTFTLTWEAQT